jgi:hypothetical protein
MKRWFYKIWRSWNPWYTLEVDYRGATKRIIVKDFKKKTPKHISGTNADGEFFELKCDKPMDFYIEEYRADLK